MKLKVGRVLTKREKSQSWLAEAIGVSRGYISQIISGQRENPSQEILEKIADALDVDVGALWEATRAVPVAGRVGAGSHLDLVDAYPRGDGLYHIACPEDLPAKSVVGVEVSGESMLPVFAPGDIILFTRHFVGVDPSAIGRVCICETEGGQALLKQVKPGREPGTFDLHSLNIAQNAPEYGVKLKWAAPYRRHLRKEDVERM